MTVAWQDRVAETLTGTPDVAELAERVAALEKRMAADRAEWGRQVRILEIALDHMGAPHDLAD